MKEKREIALITRGEWVKRKPFPNLKESGKLPPERVPAYPCGRGSGRPRRAESEGRPAAASAPGR